MKDSLKKLWILTCGVIFTEFSQTSANRQETVQQRTSRNGHGLKQPRYQETVEKRAKQRQAEMSQKL